MYSEECSSEYVQRCPKPYHDEVLYDLGRYNFVKIGSINQSDIVRVSEIWMCDSLPDIKIWSGDVFDDNYCVDEFVDTVHVLNDSLICSKRIYEYKTPSISTHIKGGCNEYDTLPNLNNDDYDLVAKGGATFTNADKSMKIIRFDPLIVLLKMSFSGKKCGRDIQGEKEYTIEECNKQAEKIYPCYQWIKKSPNKR